MARGDGQGPRSRAHIDVLCPQHASLPAGNIQLLPSALSPGQQTGNRYRMYPDGPGLPGRAMYLWARLRGPLMSSRLRRPSPRRPMPIREAALASRAISILPGPDRRVPRVPEDRAQAGPSLDPFRAATLHDRTSPAAQLHDRRCLVLWPAMLPLRLRAKDRQSPPSQLLNWTSRRSPAQRRSYCSRKEGVPVLRTRSGEETRGRGQPIPCRTSMVPCPSDDSLITPSGAQGTWRQAPARLDPFRMLLSCDTSVIAMAWRCHRERRARLSSARVGSTGRPGTADSPTQ